MFFAGDIFHFPALWNPHFHCRTFPVNLFERHGEMDSSQAANAGIVAGMSMPMASQSELLMMKYAEISMKAYQDKTYEVDMKT